MSEDLAADDFYSIEPHGRFWAVYENPENLLIEEELAGRPERLLVAVCVYRKGAEEVKRRLSSRVALRTRQIFWRPCCQETQEEAETLAADGPGEKE